MNALSITLALLGLLCAARAGALIERRRHR